MLAHPTEPFSWTRQESAARLTEFEAASDSQRQFERDSGVPRTTLQHWLTRKAQLASDKVIVAFFESPEGTSFLHRLQTALFFVFDFVTSAGLRRIGCFLDLAGLSAFTASSFGSCQRVSKEMEAAVAAFAKSQRDELAPKMPPRKITLCEDETFHPEICLVAIEPVSDFIVVETHSEKRDAASWNKAVETALQGLPVTVRQSTSDEAKGLLAHAKDGLGAHHSPDVFHIQQELSRATSVGLASQARQAQEVVAQATAALEECKLAEGQWHATPHNPGRPPDFEERLRQAHKLQQEALSARETAQNLQELAKEAIRGVSQAYHPVDLTTGKVQSAADVEKQLKERFAEVKAVAKAANLPERCEKGIRKAERLVAAMVSTVAFFHAEVMEQINTLELPPEVKEELRARRISAAYLKAASGKAKGAEARKELEGRAAQLRKESDEALAKWGLSAEQQEAVKQVGEDCVEIFQRSSSCVEGRNGQLSLRHHSLHRLSKQRLEALTATHNYFVKRPDGTTAAERFFRNKPADLFEHLVNRMELPARPAKKRPRPPQLH